MSRIGGKPIIIPKEVKVEIKDGYIYAQGPKGNFGVALHSRINLETKENQIFVKRVSDIKLDKSLHGLYHALIVNMFKGVTEGYLKELEIIGVGYKAQVEGRNLKLHLGFSHPIDFLIPEGIEIETPKQTQIIIRGIDKEKVGHVSHSIRSIRPPEPYKGKGVRFAGEYVKKKAGKAQATSK